MQPVSCPHSMYTHTHLSVCVCANVRRRCKFHVHFPHDGLSASVFTLHNNFFSFFWSINRAAGTVQCIWTTKHMTTKMFVFMCLHCVSAVHHRTMWLTFHSTVWLYLIHITLVMNSCLSWNFIINSFADKYVFWSMTSFTVQQGNVIKEGWVLWSGSMPKWSLFCVVKVIKKFFQVSVIMSTEAFIILPERKVNLKWDDQF